LRLKQQLWVCFGGSTKWVSPPQPKSHLLHLPLSPFIVLSLSLSLSLSLTPFYFCVQLAPLLTPFGVRPHFTISWWANHLEALQPDILLFSFSFFLFEGGGQDIETNLCSIRPIKIFLFFMPFGPLQKFALRAYITILNF